MISRIKKLIPDMGARAKHYGYIEEMKLDIMRCHLR